MASVNARRRWRSAAYVAPLVLVIAGALVWSSFATFEYATGRGVPGEIAWTLPLALDGTVAVTTPIWLSTRLRRGIRNYAGVICMLALGGSMAVNAAETDWVGIFPPLIAGALIHLVGVVLRAFAQLDDQEAAPAVESVEAKSDAPSAVESAPGPAEPTPVSVRKVAPTSQVALPPAADVPSNPPVSLARSAETAADVGKALLNSAYAHARDLPGGAEITAACRDAGFEVNDNYGRSLKARWLKEHPNAREEATV